MPPSADLALLNLLQFADSALPIGSQSHSFGFETLIAEEWLTVDRLEAFLHDYLFEIGALDGLFCRAAYALAAQADLGHFAIDWRTLNYRLSALRPARESRTASATLGRRFLALVIELAPNDTLYTALQTAKQTDVDLHHATAFGLVGGVLGFDEEMTVLAYLQQMVTGLLSAVQKLLPIGQSQVIALRWRLKSALVTAANRGRDADWRTTAVPSFGLLAEIAAMRHPQLPVRLFIS